MLYLLLLMVTGGSDMISIGETHTIHSHILNEDRIVSVALPAGYQDTDEGYPVLLVLDGGTPTAVAHALSTMEILDGKGQAPQMIIAGVDTGHGVRDYFPLPLQGRPGSGKASDFLEFLSRELLPWLDGSFRTENYRILYGASNGGMFAVYAMLEHSPAFSGYIAASPSLGWFPEYFSERLASFSPDSSTRFYMNWGTNDLENIVLNATPELAEELQELFDTGGCFHHEVIRQGGHVPYISLHNGLEFVFRGWLLCEGDMRENGLSGLLDHYAGLSIEYGFPVKVPSGRFMSLGQYYFRSGRTVEALEVYEQYTVEYPGSAMASFFRGECCRLLDRPDEAASAYRRALELNPSFALASEKLSALEEGE